ncbi:hypothetical protein BDW02DRAFT_75734 [Decorospora gaudefroyi]|uniref:MYND-type domain-containing protein n=1 Tax=Decorospora gaudefroyi TaxID=184978 RepID=A0A6A5K0A9_9PLEO|nr:hypothetical protein BDW02DRAFT_75734 [Decorospora gaudefroyi]
MANNTLIPLPSFRLPDYPDTPLHLNGAPLSILNTTTTTTTTLTPATGLSTILYNWHPNTLSALLDPDAWFSLTWTRSAPQQTIEIGRIRNQITFGTLSADGTTWLLMLSYNIVPSGPARGTWVPNCGESMQGCDFVAGPELVDELAQELLTRLLRERVWETGKGVVHRFYVEYAAMEDVWGDGIAMSPHWLYEAPQLVRCTNCGCGAEDGLLALKRCGRCGTAAYCSDWCQRVDWKVHKHICGMSLEERGQALRISGKGGLVAWGEREGVEGEESANPNFERPQRKRRRGGVRDEGCSAG